MPGHPMVVTLDRSPAGVVAVRTLFAQDTSISVGPVKATAVPPSIPMRNSLIA